MQNGPNDPPEAALRLIYNRHSALGSVMDELREWRIVNLEALVLALDLHPLYFRSEELLLRLFFR